MRVTVVVPTIREKNIVDFLDAWRAELSGAQILVVEDNPERTFDIRGDQVHHYCWEDIDRELGSQSWIIPRRTDCVRSFGYYLAYRTQPDMIVTLDDDCYPDPNFSGFLERHWARLQNASDMAWVSSVEQTVPRGVPYFERERCATVALNHGLWNNIPDYDAPTQLLAARVPMPIEWQNKTIPRGKYFPMCGMNIAWRPDLTPALYFLLMGQGYPYDRFGDIWAGIFVKRICDHLGFAVNSGEPAISHQRASNVWANLRKEAPGLEVNERLWTAVDEVVLTGEDFGSCYQELADKLPLDGDYWNQLKCAMRGWCELFEETPAVGRNAAEALG